MSHALPTMRFMLPALLLLALTSTSSAAAVFQKLSGLKAPDANILQSALGWKDCSGGVVLRPQNTDQLADAIMKLYQDTTASKEEVEKHEGAPQQQQQRFLVRATTQDFFTHNNFSCAAWATASEAQHTVTIDMSDMRSVIHIHEDSITVQAGITFQELEDVLLSNQRSLPGVVVAPHLSEMTIGSALVTGAHGSSLVGPATLAPFVTKAIMIDGTGQVHALDSPGDLLEASLGMLGVVTEVTLEVEPARKVAVKQIQAEDVQLVDDLREIIENSEAVSLDVTWCPSAGMYSARVWHDVEPATAGEAQAVYMRSSVEWLQRTNRRLLEDEDDARDSNGVMCELMGGLTTASHFQDSAPASGEEGDASGSSENSADDMVVGWLNRMASSRCPQGGDCLWRQAKWTPYEFAIASEDFANWVDDVREIMQQARGCPSFLFHFRFVMESDAPLALHSGRQVVMVEMSTHSAMGSGKPVKQQGLFEEVAQLTLCKYHGRPNWALATNRMFLSQCPLRDVYGADFDAFLEQRSKYDPEGLFTPPLFKRIINKEQGSYGPGCAVNGECFCREDVHCGSGHVCVPGTVFTDYKVCVPDPHGSKEL